MSQTLTNALLTYKAQQEAAGEPVILDQIVFALIPGLDPEAPIDPDETLPPEDKIQYRYDIPDNNKGFINPNAVVYSSLLGTDIGTWNYNAIYLINKDLNLTGAIIHEPEQTKVKADPLAGIQGDTITRNIVTPYENAQELTQINISADTWQLDFNSRLSAMDERVRQNNITEYGHAAFLGDGWKITHTAGDISATIAPGIGYVGGLKATLDTIKTIDLTGIVLPKTIYLVTSFEGQANSAWTTNVKLQIEDFLPDEWISNGVTYYAAPLALLSSSDDAQDLRTPDKESEFERKDNAASNQEIDDESTAAKHIKLPQFWRGIKKFFTDSPNGQSSDLVITQKALSEQKHNASDITAGTLSNDRLNKASTSQQGIVQTTTSLGSTRSDLAAAASSAKALNDKIDGIISGFSSGQTWKRTSGKVFNVNYTNSNPYPIQIYVSGRHQGSTGGTAFLIVDGVNVGWHNAVNTGSGMSNEIFSAIIPPGSVYQVQTPNSDWSKTAWAELY